MVGPPRAMERANGLEEDEDGVLLINDVLVHYVTQRLPGIRPFYPSGRPRHKRRQGPASTRKYGNMDQDIVPNFHREAEDEASALGSEYNSPKKKKSTKGRAPTSNTERECCPRTKWL